MKSIYVSLLIALLNLTFFNCKDTNEDSKQKSNTLISAQTLGLAHLEEFNLEEAEKEFLKVIELAPNEKHGYANLGLTYLRMSKYKEAEKQLFKAIKIDSKDADIRLLLATVYQMNGQQNKAILELEQALIFAPNHVKILYTISELYSLEKDEQSKNKREKYITQLVKKAPDNLVPKLHLIDIYIKKQENDKAIEQLEIILKQFPEFPKEAVPYYDNTLSALKKLDTDAAPIQFTIFHNYLKVSFPYQSGIKKLKGPGGALIGSPLITYNLKSNAQTFENASVLDIIKFTDVTSSVGLEIIPTSYENENSRFQNSTHVAVADYDGDDVADIYVGSYDENNSSYKNYLFTSDMDRFWDVSEELGLKESGIESSATFTDYDNDGFLDILILNEKGKSLYRNVGKGAFKDVSTEAKLNTNSKGKKALFFDLDHDGDLDLFETSSTNNKFFQNNGDGTFQEQGVNIGSTKVGVNTVDAAFGDFDDDGDIDLFIANENSNNIIYDNQRHGVFKDITDKSGIRRGLGTSSVSVGDYNNDGFLDILNTTLNGEKSVLYKNLGNGNFELEKSIHTLFNALKNTEVIDSEFFDFDNDGRLDIIIAGKPKKNEDRGVYLFHNEGNGKFTDTSHLLPNTAKSGKQITVFDYNKDGDLDLIITGFNGGISLLRNDGGNINNYVNLKLVGLRTGSAKNNYFGIGAKVEMRSGDLYQTMVVTNPNVHFGLGDFKKVDIIRITWTNGVPQNIFLPEANQALIESQVLKGSCPFLYTWNGKEYTFVKDITWRSALGMPLGILAGTTMHAFADASDDYIKIPGDMLKPKNGEYSLKVTSELWETIYMDKIQLIAIDHPDSIDVFVPEQFSPPPFPGLDLYQVKNKSIPISAFDSNKNNVLSFIAKKDDNYLSNFKLEKYQGVTETHDLILDPGEIGNSKKLILFLNGWIFPTDASINIALSQSDKIKIVSPIIQVINKKGEWETVGNLGFPMGKDKTVIADLSDKFLSKDRRVRIQTNMEIYWDYIFFSNDISNVPVVLNTLNPTSANIHYRGFSRTYKKGGRYGPHWFDYYNVSTDTKWRDLTGNYTRYGDVLPLLKQSDNKYIISNAGDEMAIKFNANELPELKNGWKRDFLIHSVGWVKDGDLNTALGSTVLPLPFHGMESYPPSKKDIYPNNPELQNYQQEYNTRVVTMDAYRNSIKNKN